LKRRADGEWKKVAKRCSREEWVEVDPDKRRDPVEPKISTEEASRARYEARTADEVVRDR
jgi:hypothetical protein